MKSFEGLNPKKIRDNHSPIHTCVGKTPYCLGKFIKTRGREQKYCLHCLKELVLNVPVATPTVESFETGRT